jgi:hypothetical protein
MTDAMTAQPVELGAQTLPRQEAAVLKLAETKTQTLDEAGDIFSQLAGVEDDAPIFGNQIISPSAVRVDDPRNPDGSISYKAAEQRGWLSAINRANAEEVPDSQKGANIQEIATAAIAAGVPKEMLLGHLQALGINAISQDQAAAQPVSDTVTSETTAAPLNEERVHAYLTEMLGQIPKVKEGSLTQSQFQAFITEAKAAGVPVDRIKSTLEAQGINVVPPQENNNPQATSQTAEQPAQNTTTTEAPANDETTQAYQQQIESFLQIVATDPALQRTLQNYREKTGTTDTDMQILAKMGSSMYELIHKSGMTREALVDSLHAANVDEYIADFDSDNTQRLRDRVVSTSKVRPITDQELIDGGQSDQAAGFVWFKGNAARLPNAREVRFYLNASPEGTLTVAEKLAKLSDFLDQYGIRMQYKFRKDFEEYTRTDTCVSYVYIPEATTPEQQGLSDQWLNLIQENMSRMPQDALRPESSSFTHQIADGISYVEDTRDESGKKGESYTSRITKTIAETCGELAGQYDSLTPEAMKAVAARAASKLKQLNYI